MMELEVQSEDRLDYRPGHVCAVAYQPATGLRLRHPYTVVRCDPAAHRITLLFRVIQGGSMSPVLAELPRGAELSVQGVWGEPIGDLVGSEVDHLIGLCTGAGLGPLAGFALDELVQRPDLHMTLIAGFRRLEDVALDSPLLALVGSGRFAWHPVVSRAPEASAWGGHRGRVTDVLLELFQDPDFAGEHTHIHLVGNGGMVNFTRTALVHAQHPPARVSHEIYFNRTADIDPDAAEELGRGLHRALVRGRRRRRRRW